MSEPTVSRVPQVRFKGFEDEWEEKTLGELGHVATNKRIFMHQTASIGDVPFFKIGSFGREPTLFISQSLFDTYKARFPFPQKGDLLFSVIGSIGRVVEYTGQDEYFQDSNIVWLQHNGAVVNGFLKQFYSIVKWSGLEGSTIIHLYNRNILETKIVLPCQSEQTKIGDYFRELDSLIGLHQRKHDKLVALKKSMLQKMFPQPGATSPEIRFKGFSGDWVEMKLGNVGTFNPKDSLPEVFEYVDLESVVGTEMISHRTETKKTAPSRAQRLAQQGDLFFQTVRPYQKNNYLFTLPFSNYVFSTGYAQIRPFGDGSFLLGLMQRDQFVKVVLDNCTGTSYPAINANVLAEISVMIPPPEEQQKIGTYFRILDALISKHATQLKKLRQIKSACLQKMFV